MIDVIWEDGISVHDAFPVSTLYCGKRMMSPADRIQVDPGLAASSHQDDLADDFLAIGPALLILQLNVEGLSA